MRPDQDVLTIRAAVDRSCRWFADGPALVHGGRVLSRARAATSIRAIAAGYQALGLGKGDCIAFLCAASLEHTLAWYAAHQIGAVTVNLHLREPAAVQAALVERLQIRVLVHDRHHPKIVAELSCRFPALRIVDAADGAWLGAESDTSLEACSAVAVTPMAADDHPPRQLPAGSITLAALAHTPAEPVLPGLHEDDPAIIQLSSGSTGSPKALVHCHRSVLESWSGGIYMWSGMSPEDRFLNGFAPSFVVWLVHAGSFFVNGAGVWLQTGWDPEAFLRVVQEDGITCAALTPTQWRSVLAAGPERFDLRSLRMAAYLGEKLEPERLRELMQRVCPEFSSFYGMSECLGLGGCVARGSEIVARQKWGSVGRPNLNTDLRIAGIGMGPIGEKAIGETGEIVVRAASFATENRGDPHWLERVLTPDGWYRTGDLGRVDADGYVYLRGRADNQIATGGIKVAPEEIEQVIGAHAGVAAAAVFGRADARWGQRIVALVVCRDRALTAAELDRWCRDGRLAAFKCPKEWHFVDALPLTAVGKLDRKALAPLAPAGPEQGADGAERGDRGTRTGASTQPARRA